MHPPPLPGSALERRMADHIAALCAHPDRNVGGAGNHAATAYVAAELLALGFDVVATEFDCLTWEAAGARLAAGGETFDAQPGPYSNPVETRARLVRAATLEDLEAGGFDGAVLLLHGPVCREQLTPKDFPFYEMPDHRRIITALEAGRPTAVVAATGRNPELAGAVYPFPLIEDGDVDVPHVSMTDVEGDRLLAHVGSEVTLRIDARRRSGRAANLVAMLPGDGPGRIVAFGHIDSKSGAPGALDNATGTAILLGLAELLTTDPRGLGGLRRGPTIELVPVNGEDHYSAAGEKLWVAANEDRWDEITLGLNADGAGWAGHPDAVSWYGCDATEEEAIRRTMARHPSLVEGESWYQSDHAILVAHGRPAVAVTSSAFRELCATITHTERDVPVLVDADAVADVARFFADVVRAFGPRAPSMTGSAGHPQDA